MRRGGPTEPERLDARTEHVLRALASILLDIARNPRGTSSDRLEIASTPGAPAESAPPACARFSGSRPGDDGPTTTPVRYMG